MKKISLDYSNVIDINKNDIVKFQDKVSYYHEVLHNKNRKSKYNNGWIDLPNNYDRFELEKIKDFAEKIKRDSDVFIVIGIGGSYLGAKAAIEMLSHNFYNKLRKEDRVSPEIYFLGQNMSSTYINDLLDIIEGRDVSVNAISKSGNIIEPGIAFRIIREYMESKYGKEEAARRIYVTTGKDGGAFKNLAINKGYEMLTIPENIGGRYSVLTSAGLFPMALADIDIDEVMRGAKDAMEDLSFANLDDNSAYTYAVIRNILYSKNKTIEILLSYEPKLIYLGRWFEQLFAESEGKDGKGIFPVALNFTRDLHSIGQYIQEGRKNIFETTIFIENIENSKIIKASEENLDGLDFLSGKNLAYINKKAMEGTIKAHFDQGISNILINVAEINAYYFGYLAYFFQKACAMSSLILGVNPFNQPGVEAYKDNMYRLLGKPEMED